jgi:hypothetical protein
VLLAGVDPARNPGADNTAIAFGVLDRGRLEVVETVENLTTNQDCSQINVTYSNLALATSHC